MSAFNNAAHLSSTPFVAIENTAWTDRAHNLRGKAGAVGITTGKRAAPNPVNWIVNMFILAIILYFILPPQVLERVGWHWAGSYYGTDGPDYQKIHIATTC